MPKYSVEYEGFDEQRVSRVIETAVTVNDDIAERGAYTIFYHDGDIAAMIPTNRIIDIHMVREAAASGK